MVNLKPAPTPFVPVKRSNEVSDSEYADLRTIDLAAMSKGPEAVQKLAEELADAFHTEGFFYLVNHGISEEEMKRQTDIGWTVISETSDEEKLKLVANSTETKSYKGFKLRNYWEQAEGVGDRIEQFNWYRDITQQPMPSTIQPYISETTEFCRKMHAEVLYNILKLCALGLGLPEDELVKRHTYEGHDASWFRYMAYYDEYDEEEEKATKGLWLRGHVDFTTITLLFSQPMASLQVKQHGEWKYVGHKPGAMVVNGGQFLDWYTGGYYRAAIHRVTAPPSDQRNHTRFGVFYFAVPNDEQLTETLEGSPVMEAANARKNKDVVTSKVYCEARMVTTGKNKLHNKPIDSNGIAYDVFGGVKTAAHYE